jgi:excisionase family DNA binding protein
MTERTDTYTTPDPLLSIGDAARLLGVAIETVRRWDKAGHIKSTRTPGGQRRFLRSEVDRIRSGAAAS